MAENEDHDVGPRPFWLQAESLPTYFTCKRDVLMDAPALTFTK